MLNIGVLEMTMFMENKYTKWYYRLIDYRKSNPAEIDVEKHHIVPKCLGGTDDESNIVCLTMREHYVAHLLLTKMGTDENSRIRLHWAFHRTLFGSNLCARVYETNRKRWTSFLKENHPSKTVPGWNQKMRELVTASWENNDERRKKTSDIMKKYWRDNREELKERNRKIAKLGAAASRLVRGTKVEYNGKEYITWGDLYNETGISKHLYKKFYSKGIDPSFRVGKDGPMTKDEIEQLMEYFCYIHSMKMPVDDDDIKNVLTRIRNFGMISNRDIDIYMRKENP
jgi:hypothetical protein